jgi:hypothetical protein
VLAFALTGCSSGDESTAAEGSSVPPSDLDELRGLGIDEFLGTVEPIGSETITGVDGVADGSIVYDFDPESGAVCFRGAPYHMSVLDQGSENLIIYLQGGGACLSVICAAATEASPRGVPRSGVLDSTDAENPVGDWNMVYVPYCDGSNFSGNNDFTDSQGAVRLHHGQTNFSAALDRAVHHFPHPKRVLLAGSSAGGWGTIYQRALVRSSYPDAQFTVMNDAGIGFMTNLDFIVSEWGSQRYRPPSCAECQTHAHLTRFVTYYFEHDPEVVVGDFSAWEDSVIMSFTFQSDPAAFRKLLADETGYIAAAVPDRYRRFIVNGSQHTALRSFHTTMQNGVSVAQWLGFMINRDPAWVDMIDQ